MSEIQKNNPHGPWLLRRPGDDFYWCFARVDLESMRMTQFDIRGRVEPLGAIVSLASARVSWKSLVKSGYRVEL